VGRAGHEGLIRIAQVQGPSHASRTSMDTGRILIKMPTSTSPKGKRKIKEALIRSREKKKEEGKDII